MWLLASLGQQPFVPLNVGGWGQNQYWLSTAASNAQISLAWTVAQYADLTEVEDLNGKPGAQVAAVTRMLALDTLVQRDLPGALEDGPEGQSPRDPRPGARLSRIPSQLIGAVMARSFTRRDFLSGSLGVGAAGALHTTLGPLGSRVRARPGEETAASAGAGATSKAAAKTTRKVDRTLVLCTLFGGNDGLNTVIPYESSAYHQLRGRIAIPGDQVLPLGSVDGLKLGLNPAMPGLKSLWDAKQVAIILGSGYPDPNLSHFQSMAIMQTADPSGDSPSGWLGRWLDATGSDPMRALSVGPQVPQVFAGTRQQASTLADSTSPGSQQLGGDPNFNDSYRKLEHPFKRECALEAAIAQSGKNLLLVGAKAAAALSSQQAPSSISPNDPGDIGTQLDVIAELIKAGLPTKAYGVMTGSFDTHMNQLQDQAEMLSQVDAAVQNFMGDFPTVSGGLSPVIVIYSEFGRPSPVECERWHRPRHGEHRHRRGAVGERRLLQRTAQPEAARREREPACTPSTSGASTRPCWPTSWASDPKDFLGGRRYKSIPFLP